MAERLKASEIRSQGVGIMVQIVLRGGWEMAREGWKL